MDDMIDLCDSASEDVASDSSEVTSPILLTPVIDQEPSLAGRRTRAERTPTYTPDQQLLKKAKNDEIEQISSTFSRTSISPTSSQLGPNPPIHSFSLDGILEGVIDEVEPPADVTEEDNEELNLKPAAVVTTDLKPSSNDLEPPEEDAIAGVNLKPPAEDAADVVKLKPPAVAKGDLKSWIKQKAVSADVAKLLEKNRTLIKSTVSGKTCAFINCDKFASFSTKGTMCSGCVKIYWRDNTKNPYFKVDSKHPISMNETDDVQWDAKRMVGCPAYYYFPYQENLEEAKRLLAKVEKVRERERTRHEKKTNEMREEMKEMNKLALVRIGPAVTPSVHAVLDAWKCFEKVIDDCFDRATDMMTILTAGVHGNGDISKYENTRKLNTANACFFVHENGVSFSMSEWTVVECAKEEIQSTVEKARKENKPLTFVYARFLPLNTDRTSAVAFEERCQQHAKEKKILYIEDDKHHKGSKSSVAPYSNACIGIVVNGMRDVKKKHAYLNSSVYSALKKRIREIHELKKRIREIHEWTSGENDYWRAEATNALNRKKKKDRERRATF